MTDRPETWHADGLTFACRGCGACCRVEGYVWVDQRAIRRLARHLGLSVDEFGRRYLRRVGKRYSLVERANHECVFWEDGCAVYEARPTQCRTFPFWPELLRSRETWDQAAESCGGMNQGRLYEDGEIRALAGGAGATATGPAGGCGCDRK